MAAHVMQGSTTLPYSSQHSTGNLTFAITGSKVGGSGYEYSGTFPLEVRCTSGATTTYDSTWVILANQAYPFNYNPRQPAGYSSNIEWDSSAFVGAKSLSIHVGMHSDSYIAIQVNPTGLYYSTSAVAIYDSGAGVGQFNWLATDGGLKG